MYILMTKNRRLNMTDADISANEGNNNSVAEVEKIESDEDSVSPLLFSFSKKHSKLLKCQNLSKELKKKFIIISFLFQYYQWQAHYQRKLKTNNTEFFITPLYILHFF